MSKRVLFEGHKGSSMAEQSHEDKPVKFAKPRKLLHGNAQYSDR
jgi:hypothetical protein